MFSLVVRVEISSQGRAARQRGLIRETASDVGNRRANGIAGKAAKSKPLRRNAILALKVERV